MNHKKSSIKVKVFMYLIGFTAVLLLLLWFLQIVQLDNFYKKIKKNQLEKAAEKLLDNIDSENLEEYMHELADKYDLSINITTESGKSVYKANLPYNSHIYIYKPEQMASFVQKAEANNGSVMFEVGGRYRDFDFKETESEGESLPPFEPIPDKEPKGDKERFSDDIPKDKEEDAVSVVYVRLIRNTNGSDYVLLISSLITPVEATINTLRIQFVYISAIFVLLATSLAFIISRLVSRPIVRINESAKHLADGNFDVSFEEKGYKEVWELSRTLDYAAVELGRSERLQKELLANVSHDLRTPLTMITAYAEVMRDIPGENSPENVQVVIDEAKRLTVLVNDLLDLSKLQAGVTELNRNVFDFTTNILNVMNRFSKLTEQSGYTIKFEYRDNVKVYADEYKIYQVVYNLINNAINYAGEDKEVVVKQIVHGNIVRLQVTDHGKGIEPDELENIWDRYYKVDKNHKRAVQGSGLGLSIVHNILKLHNAKYGVDSSVGKGSTFWFELKLAKEE